MAGPEKQRTKYNQATKAFWTNFMDKAFKDFDKEVIMAKEKKRGLSAKKSKGMKKKKEEGNGAVLYTGDRPPYSKAFDFAKWLKNEQKNTVRKKTEGRNGVDLLPPRERTKAATDPLPVTVKSRKTGKIDKYKTRDMNIYNEYFKSNQRTKASVKVPKIDMGKAEKQDSRAKGRKQGLQDLRHDWDKKKGWSTSKWY